MRTKQIIYSQMISVENQRKREENNRNACISLQGKLNRINLELKKSNECLKDAELFLLQGGLMLDKGAFDNGKIKDIIREAKTIINNLDTMLGIIRVKINTLNSRISSLNNEYRTLETQYRNAL